MKVLLTIMVLLTLVPSINVEAKHKKKHVKLKARIEEGFTDDIDIFGEISSFIRIEDTLQKLN